MDEIQWTNLFINLILTAFVYLLVPLIFKVAYKNEEYDNNTAKKIVTINGIVVYILLSIYLINTEGTIANLAPAGTWCGVAYLMLRKKEEQYVYDDSQVNELISILEKEQEKSNSEETINDVDIENEENNTKNNMTYCTECGNELLENHKFCWKCGNERIN